MTILSMNKLCINIVYKTVGVLLKYGVQDLTPFVGEWNETRPLLETLVLVFHISVAYYQPKSI